MRLDTHTPIRAASPLTNPIAHLGAGALGIIIVCQPSPALDLGPIPWATR